jgi:hypothetical protein
MGRAEGPTTYHFITDAEGLAEALARLLDGAADSPFGPRWLRGARVLPFGEVGPQALRALLPSGAGVLLGLLDGAEYVLTVEPSPLPGGDTAASAASTTT